MAGIERLGVIGAGQMGNGIAHVAAQSGLQVVMLDVAETALGKAVATITKNMDRQVQKGTLPAAEKDAALARISTSTDYAAFSGCDLVIEAATEREDIKTKIFAALTPHLKADAIVATNTSSIPITRLAAATDRPGRFVGMHFFNPVPMMRSSR
jgi:3-hydroxybutyryl-CoA dehydrogenase